MKTMIISALLLMAAITTSSFVISNQSVEKKGIAILPTVSAFRVHRQGKDVSLSWSSTGGTPTTFFVERSYDGEYFDVIGTVDTNGASSFKFQDEMVPPGNLYYRICCLDENGREQAVSTVEVIRIVQRK